jgi:hypothetical protein
MCLSELSLKMDIVFVSRVWAGWNRYERTWLGWVGLCWVRYVGLMVADWMGFMWMWLDDRCRCDWVSVNWWLWVCVGLNNYSETLNHGHTQLSIWGIFFQKRVSESARFALLVNIVLSFFGKKLSKSFTKFERKWCWQTK